MGLLTLIYWNNPTSFGSNLDQVKPQTTDLVQNLKKAYAGILPQ